MKRFEGDLRELARLGFSEEYCQRLREEHEHGSSPEAIEMYARAVVAVYDDRKEYSE